MTTARWLRRNAVTVVLLVLVMVRLAFIVTYPLNDRGGDTPNYWEMMASGKSNLVHAGGYPFLVGLPLRAVFGSRFFYEHPVRASYTVFLLQNVLDVSFVMLLFFATRRIFGNLTASVCALIVGLDLQAMAATSSVYPEWLQAGLLIGALAMACFGYLSSIARFKWLYYAASAVFFVLSVLVKFNAIFAGIAYLPLFFFERAPVRRRIAGMLLAILPAFGILGAYVGLYHYPSTGTTHLSHDLSWVAAAKLNDLFHGEIAPSNGINTKRWLAFSAVLPQNFNEVAGAGMFRHVVGVLPEIRRPYRERYLAIMTADEPWLDAFLRSHDLPKNFALNLSSVPISYFIGLKESDEIGLGMFREAIRAHPGLFVRRLVRDSVQALYRGREYHYPLVPTLGNMSSLGFSKGEDLAHGLTVLKQPANSHLWPFSYSRPVVWWAGLKAFSTAPDHPLPPLIATLAVVLALLAALLRIARTRQLDIQAGSTLIVTGLVVSMIVVSCAILEYRWKEARLVLPLAGTLWGIGLTWGVRECYRAIGSGKLASSVRSARV